MVHWLLQAGRWDVHHRWSDRDAGRPADGGSQWGGVGADQHSPHQRADDATDVPAGGEVAPEAAGRHLRAGEQVVMGGVGGRYSVGSRDQELGGGGGAVSRDQELGCRGGGGGCS